MSSEMLLFVVFVSMIVCAIHYCVGMVLTMITVDRWREKALDYRHDALMTDGPGLSLHYSTIAGEYQARAERNLRRLRRFWPFL